MHLQAVAGGDTVLLKTQLKCTMVSVKEQAMSLILMMICIKESEVGQHHPA